MESKEKEEEQDDKEECEETKKQNKLCDLCPLLGARSCPHNTCLIYHNMDIGNLDYDNQNVEIYA